MARDRSRTLKPASGNVNLPGGAQTIQPTIGIGPISEGIPALITGLFAGATGPILGAASSGTAAADAAAGGVETVAGADATAGGAADTTAAGNAAAPAEAAAGSGLAAKLAGLITSPLDFLAFIAWLFDRSTLLRAVEFVSGIVLMLAGAWMTLSQLGAVGGRRARSGLSRPFRTPRATRTPTRSTGGPSAAGGGSRRPDRRRPQSFGAGARASTNSQGSRPAPARRPRDTAPRRRKPLARGNPYPTLVTGGPGDTFGYSEARSQVRREGTKRDGRRK